MTVCLIKIVHLLAICLAVKAQGAIQDILKGVMSSAKDFMMSGQDITELESADEAAPSLPESSTAAPSSSLPLTSNLLLTSTTTNGLVLQSTLLGSKSMSTSPAVNINFSLTTTSSTLLLSSDLPKSPSTLPEPLSPLAVTHVPAYGDADIIDEEYDYESPEQEAKDVGSVHIEKIDEYQYEYDPEPAISRLLKKLTPKKLLPKFLPGIGQNQRQTVHFPAPIVQKVPKPWSLPKTIEVPYPVYPIIPPPPFPEIKFPPPPTSPPTPPTLPPPPPPPPPIQKISIEMLPVRMPMDNPMPMPFLPPPPPVPFYPYPHGYF